MSSASRHHYVMGTVVSFDLDAAGLDLLAFDSAVEAACDELDRLDSIFSTWKPESPLSRLRREEIELGDAPGEIAEALELCRDAKALSRGLFDPWAMPGGVDPTGLVKGWAIERCVAVLGSAGVRAGVVNGGGDLACFGEGYERWRVGIRHPWRSDGLACIVELRAGQALATSGRYERGDHLIDPFFSGEPGGGTQHGGQDALVASASVTGPSLAMADALATAMCVGSNGALRLLSSLDGYEGYRILADGTEESTPGFPPALAA